MTTLTIKINERSKKVKAFLSFAKMFFNNEKDVEIVESGDKKTFYNTEFIEKIKKAEQNIKNGKTTRLNPNDVWANIL